VKKLINLIKSLFTKKSNIPSWMKKPDSKKMARETLANQSRALDVLSKVHTTDPSKLNTGINS
jgi:hypothetical protein